MTNEAFNHDELLEGLDFLIKNAGFPTFQEFKKNPDKWRESGEQVLAAADGSTITFRERLKTQKYMWKNEFKCESLEQVQRIARDEGFKPEDLEMSPEVRPTTKGKVEIVVHFWPKDEFKSMGGIVANDG